MAVTAAEVVDRPALVSRSTLNRCFVNASVQSAIRDATNLSVKAPFCDGDHIVKVKIRNMVVSVEVGANGRVPFLLPSSLEAPECGGVVRS